MAEFEEKLQSILGNPELMGQIMSMAGAMNQQQPPPPPPPQQSAGLPFDPSAMAGMMNLLKATQLEPTQRQLIQALWALSPTTGWCGWRRPCRRVSSPGLHPPP